LCLSAKSHKQPILAKKGWFYGLYGLDKGEIAVVEKN